MEDRTAIQERIKEIDHYLARYDRQGENAGSFTSLRIGERRQERAALVTALASHDAANATREATLAAGEAARDMASSNYSAGRAIAASLGKLADATASGADAQRENARATEASTAQREDARADQDEKSFWFRRFFGTVGVANAGAFGILATGLLQSNDFQTAARVTLYPMGYYGFGAAAAAATPLLLWIMAISKRRGIWWTIALSGVVGLTFLSSAFLVQATGLFLAHVQTVGWPPAAHGVRS